MKICVIAHPNAKVQKVEKDLLDTLHVYVKEPPLEGRANRAIIETLAEFLKVKRSQVELIQGTKSKNKTFEIH